MLRAKYLSLAAILFLFIAGCNQPKNKETAHTTSHTNDTLTFTLEKFADKLYAPVAMEHANDGSGRIFVAEQAGRIRVIKDGKLLEEPFLDIRTMLVPMLNEYMDVGILGFAFHPDYKNNGRFFVHYSASSKKKGVDNVSTLAEFKVSAASPDKADTTELILLKVDQPEANHNGGNIVFDANGYLYLGFGDGGGQGDAHGKIGNSQDLEQLLGKIIRLDVDHGKPYTIPADNPFINKDGKDEIWCYGLRMPWRISFDKETGMLFCGDVGQNLYEEVNIIEKGKNYGWRSREGFHIYDSTLYDPNKQYADPVIEYKHPEGLSITGGYIYRGKKYPALQGKYVFGDWAFKLFYMQKDSSDQWVKRTPLFEQKADSTFPFRINSFGEDEQGELYVVTQDTIGAISPTGIIYKIGLRE